MVAFYRTITTAEGFERHLPALLVETVGHQEMLELSDYTPDVYRRTIHAVYRHILESANHVQNMDMDN